MRRLISAFSTVAVVLSLTGLSGCGDSKDVSTIQESPEAKKADTAGQDAMKEFMKSKGAPKAK